MIENRWLDREAEECVLELKDSLAEDIALRIYTSRLLGRQKELVLHGGGNTSLKSVTRNLYGKETDCIYVKAAGHDLGKLKPEGLVGLELKPLLAMDGLAQMNDGSMLNELRRHLIDTGSPDPSIETLAHAFIPRKFVDHTHADSVLVLSNQKNGGRILRELYGGEVILLDYVPAGFELAKTVLEAFGENPDAKGMILMKHGVITWGETARVSYDSMIELVSKAEGFIKERSKGKNNAALEKDLSGALRDYQIIAPMIRGILSGRAAELGIKQSGVILRPLITSEIMGFLNHGRAREILTGSPLTPDHLIRIKAKPLYLDKLDFSDKDKLKKRLSDAIDLFIRDYQTYFGRNKNRLAQGEVFIDPLPKNILISGIGGIGLGVRLRDAEIARDILEQSLKAKMKIATMGGVFEGLKEPSLFDMEFRKSQINKRQSRAGSLSGKVALVTGAAGAIGSGICNRLLSEGCLVAATDLDPLALERMRDQTGPEDQEQLQTSVMDVSEDESVRQVIGQVTALWGGIDILVINAGLAHVSSLEEMELEDFRRLEKVNVEGTLILLKRFGGYFRHQGMGGDIILISTKNVFSPGASFGAYSATKAASHQLTRVASLEFAPIGVRVNMVSPDAVFSDGEIKSGLWKEVGPGRMKARGLDEEGLEAYYRERNLLKSKVTALDVGRAVLFFATRQTPTTGATLPVDGGLPDATPR
ncbi:MAG: bifunctional aldolase/short-chain dehydrogenase [Deltaproteobacteria bacterium]|nr:bifunctional aldolase/short-chain dehydrogenase [Deltaproteobacteria bacterium]